MKKVMIASALLGLTGYLLYSFYHRIGHALAGFGTVSPDQDGYGIGNAYVDCENELQPRFVWQDGVGGSDFFDMGEGGVTGIRVADNP